MQDGLKQACCYISPCALVHRRCRDTSTERERERASTIKLYLLCIGGVMSDINSCACCLPDISDILRPMLPFSVECSAAIFPASDLISKHKVLQKQSENNRHCEHQSLQKNSLAHWWYGPAKSLQWYKAVNSQSLHCCLWDLSSPRAEGHLLAAAFQKLSCCLRKCTRSCKQYQCLWEKTSIMLPHAHDFWRTHRWLHPLWSVFRTSKKLSFWVDHDHVPKLFGSAGPAIIQQQVFGADVQIYAHQKRMMCCSCWGVWSSIIQHWFKKELLFLHPLIQSANGWLLRNCKAGISPSVARSDILTDRVSSSDLSTATGPSMQDHEYCRLSNCRHPQRWYLGWPRRTRSQTRCQGRSAESRKHLRRSPRRQPCLWIYKDSLS